ncbi:kinase-like protein [Rhizophagus irregularis]|uniref:Kinase-like protein n=1 Tax=Rhizophagus irregularis TaxID=588596 RepID=A0A2I1GBW5_9GLOM|nr:kinase-like protein [Rhizophagus irregularis]
MFSASIKLLLQNAYAHQLEFKSVYYWFMKHFTTLGGGSVMRYIDYVLSQFTYWKDGHLIGWNAGKNKWDRKGGQQVKLVSQYCEKYLTSHFLKSEHDISKINPSKRLVYGITRDHETQDYAVIEKLGVRCSLCNREWMSSRWCRGCYSDHFESEFKNWTKIGQGGHGTVSKAYWEKGRIYKRDFIENKWERSGPMWVALKSIDEEQGSTAAFLKEAKAMNRCLKNDMYFLDFYGISRLPDTNKYLIVMRYFEEGDLRKYIYSNSVTNSWVNRIDRLWSIAIDLRTLHRADLVHRDLHSGKVLFGSDRRSFIADFGLACKDGQAQEDDSKGVLPYVAPEVLCRQPYMKAADVYSFGIIMWEFTSYRSPFGTIEHNCDLAIAIQRPKVIKDTPGCYIRLMKQCWDSKPANRPTAHSLADTLEKWLQIISEQKRQKNPSLIKPYSEELHPSVSLTSRTLPKISLPIQMTSEENEFVKDYENNIDENNNNEYIDVKLNKLI